MTRTRCPCSGSAVSALGTFYQDSLDPFDQEQVEISTVRLLAKAPTIAAMAHKKSVGQPYMYPDNSLSFVENFLRMTFGYPVEPYEVDPTVAKALDLLFILHADHEQNCSTSTVRLVGSAHANLFNSVSAGIHALSGPLHGGANQAVLEMLGKAPRVGRRPEEVHGEGQEQGGRCPPHGLRAPRLQELRPARGHHQEGRRRHPREGSARTTRSSRSPRASRRSPWPTTTSSSARLYPNVDFYTGLIYKAMGFESKMFTVLFAIGRLPGWIAQWREMMTDPETKIGRPRQIYTGEAQRSLPRLTVRPRVPHDPSDAPAPPGTGASA